METPYYVNNFLLHLFLNFEYKDIILSKSNKIYKYTELYKSPFSNFFLIFNYL